MDYQKFVITNYKAIVGPLEINVEKNTLIPIIGVNECGKTTILQALFAFDRFNDDLNEGRHVKDTNNLYKVGGADAVVTAVVSLDRSDFTDALDDIEKSSNKKPPAERDSTLPGRLTNYRKKRGLGPTLAVTRNIPKRSYGIEHRLLGDRSLNAAIARHVVGRLPYILYFDDFRDSIGEKIEIDLSQKESPEGWLAIIERLFRVTDPSYSVFSLPTMEERLRKSVLARVRRRLNESLTKEWQNFRLDDTDALEVSLEYEQQADAPPASRHFIKLDVIETDSNGDAHYFFVRDRSKGFFWFFNFVMKLEFNPKVFEGGESRTIYLLDEPGSYLHASAQTKLCKKLRRLGDDNRVIYCTHSHYLLDPEVIPLSTIRVADREVSGGVRLVPIFEHADNILERRSAFQPVIDALEIKPYVLDLTSDQVVIVEGIYDYYAFEMMKQGCRISFLPSVGCDSIKFYISLMIAWRVQYMALWDNDPKGREAYADAQELFGSEVASRHFRLLSSTGNRRLQDLFDGADMKLIRTQVNLPPEASFEKTIAALFFSPLRAEVINKVSSRTKQNFKMVLDALFKPLPA